MNIDLTPLFQAVIALLAVIITSFVIPYIKRKVDAADLAEFRGWVKVAVAAAEQLYEVTQGEAKKQYVVDYLAAKGYTVDPDDVENAIEAAVIQLHNELYGSENHDSQ